jgi:hypothetical protein
VGSMSQAALGRDARRRTPARRIQTRVSRRARVRAPQRG